MATTITFTAEAITVTFCQTMCNDLVGIKMCKTPTVLTYKLDYYFLPICLFIYYPKREGWHQKAKPAQGCFPEENIQLHSQMVT